MSFWQQLNRPFTVLAPMDGITDSIFRQMVCEAGKPDVCFTEFVNTDGILSEKAGIGIQQRLEFSAGERPIVAQLWGTEPEKFYRAAKKAADLGFDGIDINLGCPQRKVVKTGACAALISSSSSPSLREQVKEIIIAVREGGKLPVSIKTRIGSDIIITEDWIGFLLAQKPDAVTIHARTIREKSAVPAHWDEIGKAVRLKNKMRSSTVIIGNGDVKSLAEAKEKAHKYRTEGVMAGRAVLDNPWFFNPEAKVHTREERLELWKKHLDLWEKTRGQDRNFAEMKKFVKVYIRGFDGAAEIRRKLMKADSVSEAVRM
ncbi:MAG: tRNA-dihydrouridine synthase [Candidatus Amesbacteria bacterium GW2011_GWB1_47_19]|nr:MAG: tRNA-dihydrouridine synthase [Candidatus Amesbacteria bacterium GW2011_GWA1_44_24]KKU31631.1 MAG: tRNA-dihydrouridine synthase [Candidatus Amesbacteria bacterium GW2011_GWC1_46_24]KKU67404.1 MAG: tRNA-dihydrouridine synthase [Candidatus Amesbacteria bacterium GW2011_GWB1_47_19]OGD05378.1 MAG: hypothetical protein A2379_05365 [Candidatus Amesbacteria bacterium RIFOXYB1_FULL_47_13]HBC72545.1 dihydrouridine synthase [Candidatus Amesbacteria bacterium]